MDCKRQSPAMTSDHGAIFAANAVLLRKWMDFATEKNAVRSERAIERAVWAPSPNSKRRAHFDSRVAAVAQVFILMAAFRRMRSACWNVNPDAPLNAR